VIFPTALGYIWGDALGAFLYGGYVSKVVIWHGTWCINSLAHTLGHQEYSIENTSRGNLILAFITMGEGHHNYHHEFPKDYRNGINVFDWDPSKWFIATLSYFGQTYNLITVPREVILKAKVTTALKEISNISKDLTWTDENTLPKMSLDDYKKTAVDRDLTVIDDYVVDISKFKNQHPGGAKILEKYIGLDATKSFFGVLNNHTQSARQIMRDLRVAKIA
jgi:stearoyl-CoA desaturase (delta-9 desaturase)